MSRPTARSIAVVITHFDDQRRLDLVLAALALQTVPADAFEVVVADDGSPRAPTTGSRPYPVSVVRQADLGSRAGSTRNLGARATTAPTLVFLDGDTVPEPAFLAELAAACDERRLTVGRRRHADLTAFDAPMVRAWLTGSGPAPDELPEPAWLADAYRATDDLRRAGPRDYRYVISAVLACPRRLFDEVGGFAEELVGYGGEDWELARRCWLAGADLRHAPRAVAWHDGPDFGGRPGDQLAIKNAETQRVAALLTDPALRGTGLLWPCPRIIARLRLPGTVTEAARIASVETLLRAGDVGVWFADTPVPALPDPRLHGGLPGRDLLGRAELVLDVTAPVDFTPELMDRLERAAPVHAGGVTAASPRHIAQRTPVDAAPPAAVFGVELELEAWFAARAARPT